MQGLAQIISMTVNPRPRTNPWARKRPSCHWARLLVAEQGLGHDRHGLCIRHIVEFRTLRKSAFHPCSLRVGTCDLLGSTARAPERCRMEHPATSHQIPLDVVANHKSQQGPHRSFPGTSSNQTIVLSPLRQTKQTPPAACIKTRADNVLEPCKGMCMRT